MQEEKGRGANMDIIAVDGQGSLLASDEHGYLPVYGIFLHDTMSKTGEKGYTS